MKVKLTLAVLALIAAGCSNQDLTEAVQDSQENNARVVNLQVTLPETTDDAFATRATYESDDRIPAGIVMKWKAGDKLMLCFKYGENYYNVDAPIVPTSISADGKKATFMLTVPDEIPDADAFDFYAVYQQNLRAENYSGCFKTGTANYQFEKEEEENITLKKKGTNWTETGIINPMLLFADQIGRASCRERV